MQQHSADKITGSVKTQVQSMQLKSVMQAKCKEVALYFCGTFLVCLGLDIGRAGMYSYRKQHNNWSYLCCIKGCVNTGMAV